MHLGLLPSLTLHDTFSMAIYYLYQRTHMFMRIHASCRIKPHLVSLSISYENEYILNKCRLLTIK